MVFHYMNLKHKKNKIKPATRPEEPGKDNLNLFPMNSSNYKYLILQRVNRMRNKGTRVNLESQIKK